MQAITAGPLQAIVTGDSHENREVDVVLLHGFGAPGTDLVALGPEIPTRRSARYFFLQAPHVLAGMVGPQACRAWWHIDMLALQVARMTGQHDMLAAQVPEGLTEARTALNDALGVLVKDHGLEWSTTVLGGFSQGAMLSCDWTLRGEESIAGLIQLSGTVICEDIWKQRMTSHEGLRVFQSHAPDDQVLPYQLAERHRDNLEAGGAVVTFVPFAGGHGISREVLSGLGRFLDAL